MNTTANTIDAQRTALVDKLNRITDVIASKELCPEAMVAEIAEIVGYYGDEPISGGGFCGDCIHCRGIYVGYDKCICSLNDPHAEPDNNDPCPNWVSEEV